MWLCLGDDRETFNFLSPVFNFVLKVSQNSLVSRAAPRYFLPSVVMLIFVFSK